MKKRISLLLLTTLILTGCAAKPQTPEDPARLTIVTTTYPVYLFASAVTEGVEGIVVERLDTGSTSCLHDYTLSVNDMKKLENANVIAINGVELEEFMEDALSASDAAVIDCSEGVELLENLSHHHEEGEGEEQGHDHGHYDPHIWMSAANAMVMVENLAAGMADVDSGSAQAYAANAQTALEQLSECEQKLHAMRTEPTYSSVYEIGLVTFHDGFQYFAHAYDLTLLESIEEEAGSEASAKEITEITELVRQHHLPVIFTEVNGSEATAQAIARETGCQVAQLTMLMDGEGSGLDVYCQGLLQNMETVTDGFSLENMG